MKFEGTFLHSKNSGLCTLDRFNSDQIWKFQKCQLFLSCLSIAYPMLEKKFCSNIAPSPGSGPPWPYPLDPSIWLSGGHWEKRPGLIYMIPVELYLHEIMLVPPWQRPVSVRHHPDNLQTPPDTLSNPPYGSVEGTGRKGRGWFAWYQLNFICMLWCWYPLGNVQYHSDRQSDTQTPQKNTPGTSKFGITDNTKGIFCGLKFVPKRFLMPQSGVWDTQENFCLTSDIFQTPTRHLPDSSRHKIKPLQWK